ncbi:MAG: hypothetical protein KBE91_04040 [Bacteroidia bacterium]|nr:hypothetical protein [Bacteroidia bacterium]MBP9688757.1 hypothetical protein [Bacteroidia bacterium]
MIKHLLLLILMALFGLYANAQFNGSYRSKNILIISDSLLLDTAVILQQSLLVYQNEKLLQDGVDYSINYFDNFLKINPKYLNQTIQVSYKTAIIDFKKQYSNKPRSLQIPVLNGNKYDLGYNLSNGNRNDLFKNEGLKLNGSISRGLGFGNNQDIVLNANLNLQMAGRINNDIDVLAAISDDNNPIQPEGNTQQLQDFDKVFIQLAKNKTTLTVGDFEMSKPEGAYFMNYYKKSRGAQFNSEVDLSKKSKLKFGGEGALSRGRFARNIINGIEGNQGPYRLNGTNGELFIIIISGTEAVYLDGQKLTRGEQHDYVIDYNTGEVTFMPKRPINQYSRIVVEFQFADRNYARSVFHVNTDFEMDKFKLRVNYFTEQDNKDQPFLQTLNDSTKQILAAVGDNINDAVINSEVQSSYDPKKVQYRKTDTLIYQNIFVYAPQQGNDSVFYEVRFSLVGQGLGNYKQVSSSANGRVYAWVEPVSGIPQGDYEPVIKLISPKRRQMLTVGAEITAIKNTLIKVELANSQNDLNTFSNLDKKNDAGYGVKALIENTWNLTKDKKEKDWVLKTSGNIEVVDEEFRYIERYRNVEFDRTWNRLLTNQNSNVDTGYLEQIASLRTALQKGNTFQIYYQLGTYNRQKLFNGLQHQTGMFLNWGKNTLTAESEWVSTTNNILIAQQSNVNRYKGEYTRRFYNLIGGVKAETEHSYFKQNSDTLLGGSYGYNQFGGYITNVDSNKVKYRLDYNKRTDLLPRFNDLAQSTIGHNFNASADVRQNNGNRLAGSLNYREFIIEDTLITTLKPERTILARIEYDYSFLKRVFVANTYYQIGSGQELRRDFQYVEVLVGQGQYVWKDFNKDGAQQLNEFVIAGSADKPQANYIRVFLPTNSYISTNANQFNQTLNINPAAVWNNKKHFKKLVSKFSNQTALKIDRKTTQLETKDFINPFLLNVNDTSLISLNSLFRNTLFFNRSNPTFGADFTFQNQKSKTFLTNGFESRNRTEQGVNIRWNINAIWGITLGTNTGQRIYTSDFFSSNNFNYYFIEFKPRLSYQLNTRLRITALAGYFEGNNLAELGNQNSNNKELGAEFRYSLVKQGVINAKLSSYQISFNGDAQSQLGYDMLQGLAVGQNTVWNINYQQRLGNNLQITINYDGRTADTQRTIHIGRMEARYLF